MAFVGHIVGGAVKGIGKAFKGVGKAIGAVGRGIGHAVKGIVKGVGKVARYALPPIVGLATGNPWLIGATGALVNVDRGLPGMVMGGLGAGLGAHYGGMLLNEVSANALTGVAGMPLWMAAHGGSVVGSALGGFLGNRMGKNMYAMQKALMSPPGMEGEGGESAALPKDTPDILHLPPAQAFPILKLEAIHKTREAFKNERVYEVIEEQMKPEPFHKHFNVYNRPLFPKINDVLKKRARKQRRKEVA